MDSRARQADEDPEVDGCPGGACAVLIPFVSHRAPPPPKVCGPLTFLSALSAILVVRVFQQRF